jgi:hypothetical protein
MKLEVAALRRFVAVVETESESFGLEVKRRRWKKRVQLQCCEV